MENDYEKKILEQFETPVEIHSNKRKVLFVNQGYKYYEKNETLVYIKWSCYTKSCVVSFKIIIEDKDIFVQKDHNHDFMTSSELRLLFFRESIFLIVLILEKQKMIFFALLLLYLMMLKGNNFPR